MSKKMYINLTDDEFDEFEYSRLQLGMKRGKFLKYLLGGQKEIRPASIVSMKLIDAVSEVGRNLKIIAMKDELSDNDKIYICEQIRNIEELLATVARSCR